VYGVISQVFKVKEWVINHSEEFENWWKTLTQYQQISISASIKLLQQLGPALGFPHSSGIQQSRHTHMRELRIQHRGRPIRVLYAFDPKREALLLIGGDKTGNDRWYEEYVPIADKVYDQHLQEHFTARRK